MCVIGKGRSCFVPRPIDSRDLDPGVRTKGGSLIRVVHAIPRYIDPLIPHIFVSFRGRLNISFRETKQRIYVQHPTSVSGKKETLFASIEVNKEQRR